MTKIIQTIQSYLNCLGWVLLETFKAFWEQSPDLKFWDPPKHPSDFFWYAERVNGRLAMLTLTVLLVLDLISS